MADFEDILYPITPEVQKLLDDGHKILDEVLRYGVYLYEIIYEDNQHRTGMADTVLGLFFREALELTDGITILLKSCCVSSNSILARSLFELYAQIKVMGGEDSGK